MSESNERQNNQNTPSGSDLDEAIRRDEEARNQGEGSSDDQGQAPASAADSKGEEEPGGHSPAEAEDNGSERERPDEDDEQTKRIARLAYEARQERNRARQLEQEVARLRGQQPPLPQDEQQKRELDARAAAMADQRIFDKRATEIYEKGVTEFDDFKTSLEQMRESGVHLTRELIEAVDDIGDPHKYIRYLAKNLDIAERIAGLPPHRMGVELAKLQTKVSPPKPVSRAPAPIKPISGRSEVARSIEDMPLDEFMRLEDEKPLSRRHR